MTQSQTEVKQVVGKRKNKKRYSYPLPVSLPGGGSFASTYALVNVWKLK